MTVVGKTKKKQALFLFPTDIMGGAENVLRLAAKAALDSGDFYQVDCFVLCKQPTGSLDGLAADPRVELTYSGAKSEKGGLVSLARVLAAKQYDLVFSSHTHLNAAASLFRKLNLLKTHRLVARESTMIFERDMGWRGMLARRLYTFYGAQDLIICQTARMAESLNLHTKNRLAPLLAHIPNPIDIATLSRAMNCKTKDLPSLADDAQMIAWCGRLAPVKSPLRAIDALDELVNSGNNRPHLVMIGDGPMREEILSYADAKGLSHHLTLTGRVAQPVAIMRHCQAGLMTSDVEGFPNVILEMLAAGIRRVVTTDCAGGLDRIPGVTVAGQKTAHSLAGCLSFALQRAEPDGQVSTFLEERSPGKFFHQVLTG